MKARMLTRVNALIVFLIGLLGIGTTGCQRIKYGVPYYEEPEYKHDQKQTEQQMPAAYDQTDEQEAE